MDTTKETTEGAPSLSQILSDLTYPAEKWQITTCAEIYGADIRTRRELYKLPARAYRSAMEIAETMA
jgi:hypothetical protein